MRGGWLGALAPAAAAAVLGFAGGAAAQSFDPGLEARNFSKTQERQTIYGTPGFQAELAAISARYEAQALAIQASDPERNFTGHLCAGDESGCAGDVRLYDWGPKGYGIVRPFLYTARNGATIS